MIPPSVLGNTETPCAISAKKLEKAGYKFEDDGCLSTSCFPIEVLQNVTGVMDTNRQALSRMLIGKECGSEDEIIEGLKRKMQERGMECVPYGTSCLTATEVERLAYKPQLLQSTPEGAKYQHELDMAMDSMMMQTGPKFRYYGTLLPQQLLEKMHSIIDDFLTYRECGAVIIGIQDDAEHWTALFFCKPSYPGKVAEPGAYTILYFDSLNRFNNNNPNHTCYTLKDFLVLFYESTSSQVSFQYSQYKHQNDKSEVCGIYCLWFITACLIGQESFDALAGLRAKRRPDDDMTKLSKAFYRGITVNVD
jgi:hypothetical protein